jgi:hypothetical protein
VVGGDSLSADDFGHQYSKEVLQFCTAGGKQVLKILQFLVVAWAKLKKAIWFVARTNERCCFRRYDKHQVAI